MLQLTIKNMLEAKEKNNRKFYQRVEIISQKIEYVKINKNEILELKTTIKIKIQLMVSSTVWRYSIFMYFGNLVLLVLILTNT